MVRLHYRHLACLPPGLTVVHQGKRRQGMRTRQKSLNAQLLQTTQPFQERFEADTKDTPRQVLAAYGSFHSRAARTGQLP